MNYLSKIHAAALILALSASPLAARANEKAGEKPTETKRIEDNSFLLEEAYNQEPRVVQHIQNFMYSKRKNWDYTFTQEWPISGKTHQLSYTLPFSHLADGPQTGIKDVLINYRYQLVDQEAVAVAPRLSVITPTGDYKRGLGSGGVGFQTSLPISVLISSNWVTHWNLGATFTPSGKDALGGKVRGFQMNYGASLIWVGSQSWNPLVEIVGSHTEATAEDGTTAFTQSLQINPGVRFAINFPSGLQIVPGLSLPIGIGPSAGEYSGLLYLSFEHPY